jgi:hypothetical protein
MANGAPDFCTSFQIFVQIFAPPPIRPCFRPYRRLRLLPNPKLRRELLYQPRDSALAFVLSLRLIPDLGHNHRNDSDDLRLRCKPVGVEIIGGPGEIVAHAVETETQEMLDLFRGTPPVPAGWFVDTSDGQKPRDDYQVAVLVDRRFYAACASESLASADSITSPGEGWALATPLTGTIKAGS